VFIHVNEGGMAATLVLVAKQPGPTCKTRLAMSLASSLGEKAGREAATAFALSSLSDLLERLAGECHRRVLLYAPPTEAARDKLSALTDALGVRNAWELNPVLQQADGGPPTQLGDILADAATRCRAPAAPILIFIGMDCPTLPAFELENAARVCSQPGCAYICPATDGGYALIGLPADVSPAVAFARVRWSASDTCESQIAALAHAGYACERGQTYGDVDEAEDLHVLARHLQHLPKRHGDSPRVRSLLQCLGMTTTSEFT
jgi:glycosyltransferase A (GT-A) superfamily protein (DUF2064 family)